ncbi:tRNA (adenosine(37)-N6)-dimethylallyltransferase MiaA [Candidatus Dojkabacteria bacterium]|uniref:tRNA dimethylallyltransferase n=1 Tax=Candidatus Dojkabacteria bacterium TaxID=2099670 RepID=A0A847EU90_9BACT|nr:tRNA (adenosine(37)-N6)-dimethylallyltransferase MiaA [Candidatus Dojkabacteria bacterium]
MDYILDIKIYSQMIDYKGKIIVVAGPTASGKSDIALSLAKEVNGYIINGDSRQLYTDLNIGTSKPKFDSKISKGEDIKDGISHFLYDYINPKESFTLYDYQKDVNTVLNSSKGIPILVGGSGLYIDSVIFNYNLVKNSKEILNLESKTVKELQELANDFLKDMNESDRANRHRLIRAITRGGINTQRGEELENIYFVIDIDRDTLKERVRKRIDKMFKEGLLEENTSLLDKGYTYVDKGMNSIGYIEFKEYFENKISIDDVKEEIFKNTMAYIKRQRTWFRRNKNSIWVDSYNQILKESLRYIDK